MNAYVVIGLLWFPVTALLALAIGRAFRAADRRDDRRSPPASPVTRHPLAGTDPDLPVTVDADTLTWWYELEGPGPDRHRDDA
ncbi:hypothetical protein [Geodermatophilus sp. FMUSA9-8]|uniref:hypothetical protein n=1 Tax=Geodermatophilus sp. FMUSA9-8 TaxID=3120155 RepID=UPI0030095894